jgi:protein required for attachment to host cells
MANHSAAQAFPSRNRRSAMKPTVTWIVIADGGQAKVFEHDGPGKGLRAVKDLQLKQSNLKAGDIMSDRPGSSQGGSAGSHSSMSPSTDPVQARERKFVEQLADVLEAKRAEGAFDRLVIAAAPTALGDLRPALSEGVKKTIIGEMPKDLTNIPMAQLAGHFDELIAV